MLPQLRVSQQTAFCWKWLVPTALAALEQADVGRVSWASPFLATVPGTDTYADRLWPEGG